MSDEIRDEETPPPGDDPRAALVSGAGSDVGGAVPASEPPKARSSRPPPDAANSVPAATPSNDAEPPTPRSAGVAPPDGAPAAPSVPGGGPGASPGTGRVSVIPRPPGAEHAIPVQPQVGAGAERPSDPPLARSAPPKPRSTPGAERPSDPPVSPLARSAPPKPRQGASLQSASERPAPRSSAPPGSRLPGESGAVQVSAPLSPAIPPLPALPVIDGGDPSGLEEPVPTSIRPMRIIAIGTSQPPQPEKRRGPPPAEVLAKMLAPLNLAIDEAPDIEVEVSIDDEEHAPESVEEIVVDPEDAAPDHGGRSRPPPPPRSKTSEPPVPVMAAPPVPEGLDEEAAPVTVEEPAVSLADVDLAPASEPDVEGIEDITDEPAKPPPPPKRRPRASQGSVPDIEAATASKKRARPWWEDLFTEDFARGIPLLTEAQVAREVTYIEESLGVARGGIILDLACGLGQQAVEFARRGYSMVGVDLSLPQLAAAGELAQSRGQRINFLQGDMREMRFEETFDGIYCWNTSFGYFEEEKNIAVAHNIFRALRSGGSFLLDVVNRDFVVSQQPSSVWFEGDGCVCMDEMQVDFITSRMRVKRTLMMDDGRTRECNYSIRVYSLHELGKMLHDIGFRVTEATGHPAYPGVFFGATSPRVIIVAQKP
jgi:SAM-dependent methyltransferase